MTYNGNDKTVYGDTYERIVDIVYRNVLSAKWYDTGEGVLYISDGTMWRLQGEQNPKFGRY